ncbi:hypothetical protein M3Y98_00456800 [Aphelenchoides besseyi]|nr:hypothetical protein M3Y98_00456800 [Aphelenchoides besseyi]KAI6207450.1 hypothetical protein M3Y96_00010200 [Aphelenchoides besseyi]
MLGLLFLLVGIKFVSSLNPCDGKIVVVLDASVEYITFSTEMFNNQNNFVKTLFSGPYFDSYERLALGSYNRNNPNLTRFGDFCGESDVTRYVDSIQQDQHFTSTIQSQFFVSVIYGYSLDSAREYTQKMQAQGVRVAFIGHSQTPLNIQLLNNLSDDYKNWFKWVLKCQAPKEIGTTESPTNPCNGKIIKRGGIKSGTLARTPTHHQSN